MAKVQIKSEKLTPFGGIFSTMEQFDALLAQTIESTLALRCTMFGYQFSEILRSLMCVYLCGGSCICLLYTSCYQQFVSYGSSGMVYQSRADHSIYNRLVRALQLRLVLL